MRDHLYHPIHHLKPRVPNNVGTLHLPHLSLPRHTPDHPVPIHRKGSFQIPSHLVPCRFKRRAQSNVYDSNASKLGSGKVRSVPGMGVGDGHVCGGSEEDGREGKEGEGGPRVEYGFAVEYQDG